MDIGEKCEDKTASKDCEELVEELLVGNRESELVEVHGVEVKT